MSPKRPDPRALLEREDNGGGRQAVYGGRRPASTTEPPAPSWEERHKRVTFHCPLDLLEALESEVSTSGRKKNTVILDALREHLQKEPAPLTKTVNRKR